MNRKHSTTYLQLQLQEVLEPSKTVRIDPALSDRLAELEWQMTHHAFAHHYAVTLLSETQPADEEVSDVLEDIEMYKSAYFRARHEFAALDGGRLQEFEVSLAVQKELLRSAPRFLH